jgi:hypothetical protein
MTTKTENHQQIFSTRDPLFRFSTIISKSPVLLGIAYVLLINSFRLLVALFYGQVRTKGNLIGFFDDPGQYTNMLYGAVLWSFYFWIPSGIDKVFTGLTRNKVIGGERPSPQEKGNRVKSYSEFVAQAMQSFNSWWFPIISMSISVAIYALAILPGYMTPSRMSTNWALNNVPSLVLGGIWMVSSLYAIIMLIISCLISIYWLRRIFIDFETVIRPFHPDKAGGLSPLGDFTLSLSYLITASGALLVFIPITREYVLYRIFQFSLSQDIVIGIIAYLILAPIAFFAPLSVAHKSMKSAKEKILLQIDEYFQDEMAALQVALVKKDPIDQNKVSRLKDLQSLYDTAYRFPVWPFNTENITRFTTTYLSPILLALLINFSSKMIGT